MAARLTLLAVSLAMAVSGASSALAADPVPVSGQAAVTLGHGKAGKALTRSRVKLEPVGPATVKRLPDGRFQATLPAVSLEPGGVPVGLDGGLRFRRGGRSVTVRDLAVTTGKVPVQVTARIGTRRIRLFQASGKLKVERAWQNLKWHLVAKLGRSRLDLTPAAARLLRKRLRAKQVVAEKVGVLNLAANRLETAEPPPVDIGDPYFSQCGIIATTNGAGDFPAIAPLPYMTDPAQISTDGPQFNWGLKGSLRNYLKMFGGSLHALDGAGLIGGDGKTTIVTTTFGFPVTGGEYSVADGRAVINTSGTGLFCNKVHGFRVALSNLTVVIDGANSRVDADVDYNKFGTWIETQRTTILDLDASSIDPAVNGNEVTWDGIPGKFSDAGAWPFCAEGGPPGTPNVCIYHGPGGPKGATDVDPVSVTIKAGG